MTSLFEDAIGIRAIEQEFSVLNNTEYYIYNSATGEIIRLCNYDDSDCTAALQQQGYYMLSPETYGEDAYSYPAIYTSPGIVWDQSAERNSNGDWTMYSDSNPHPTPQPEPEPTPEPEPEPEPTPEPEPEPEPTPEPEPEPTPEPEPEPLPEPEPEPTPEPEPEPLPEPNPEPTECIDGLATGSNENGSISLPCDQVDNFEFNNSDDGTLSLNASKSAEQIEYFVESAVTTSGKKISDSSFTFAENSGSSTNKVQLVVANQRITNTTFTSQGGKPDVLINSEIIKNISYESVANSRDTILIAENTMLKNGSKFNLGAKPDLITFHGELRKTSVDLGNDKAIDKIEIDSLDQITKRKLSIYNFSKKDELIIGGELFDFDDLQDDDLRGIKVFFKGEGSML